MKVPHTTQIVTMLVLVLMAAGSAASEAPPQCVSPGELNQLPVILSNCPTFSWSLVLDAKAFEIIVYELPEGADHASELDLSPDREALYARVDGNATGWTPGLDQCLEPGGNYIWFVRAVVADDDGSEATEWSDGRFFSVGAMPTAEQVAQAIEVLRRYVGETGETEILSRPADGRGPSPRGNDRFAGAGNDRLKTVSRSVPTGPAAIRGEMPDITGETYGLVGVSHSPEGAGAGFANLAGGADLVLDGSSDLQPDTKVSQSGIDRPWASAQTFEITNSAGNGMTLLIDGMEAVTTATDRDTLGALTCADNEVARWNGSGWVCTADEDTPPRDAGNQLTLEGNALDVIEGPGSGLDADTVDGLSAAAFSPAGHQHDDRYFTESELTTSGAGGAVHWENLTAVPAGFADGIDDDTTYSFGWGLMLRNGQIVLDPAAFRPAISTLDSAGAVGQHTSIAIGNDGLGIISYQDFTNFDLKVAHCTNTACSSATTTTVDSAGAVGWFTSIAIGDDGLGIISYRDNSNTAPKVAHCNDIACSSATTTIIDSAGDMGWYTSIAIGDDGLGIVSYRDKSYKALKVAHCNDTACSSATTTIIDNTGDVGSFTSIAIGNDGLGIISYYDETNDDLKVAHCNDTACSSATTTTIDSAGDAGMYTSIAIGDDGFGIISYHDFSNSDLKVAHCTNTICSNATTTTIDDIDNVGWDTSIAIGDDGLGIISYRDYTNYDLKVAHLPYGH